MNTALLVLRYSPVNLFNPLNAYSFRTYLPILMETIVPHSLAQLLRAFLHGHVFINCLRPVNVQITYRYVLEEKAVQRDSHALDKEVFKK